MTDAPDAPDEAPDDAGADEAPDDAGADQARLRPLVATDVPLVAELERQLFGPSAWSEPMIAGELHAPGRWYLAAVQGQDTLVGYAGLWFDGDAGQVMTIGVAPTLQRQGIGTLLLEVRVDKAPAMALYERFGFTILSRRRRYYQPEDADAWTMRLEL